MLYRRGWVLLVRTLRTHRHKRENHEHQADPADHDLPHGDHNPPGNTWWPTRSPAGPAESAAWGATFHAEGTIYVGDMARGLDVFTLDDPELLLKLKLRAKPLKMPSQPIGSLLG